MTRNVRIALLAAILLCCVAVTVASAETGVVCPPGNVKYEVAGGYEYTDNSGRVSVSADALTTSWQPAPGHVVTGVCVKLGPWLLFPPPSAGTLTTTTYAISHVVLTTAPALPNAVTVRTLHATAEPTLLKPLAILAVIALLAGAGVLYLALRSSLRR